MAAAHVGQALGLVPRQVRLAARAGLLRRLEDGTYDAECVARAAADPRRFWDALRREEPLNVTRAAARLGIGRERFRRVAAASGLPVLELTWVRRRGEYTVACSYRAADVDAMLPHVIADRELRAAAVAVARSRAAVRAARTRAANRERRRNARGRFAARTPGAWSGPVEIVVWAAGLALARGRVPDWLRRFRYDDEVEAVAELVGECGFTDREVAAHARAAATAARGVVRELEPPGRVRARLGVPVHHLTPFVPSVAGWLPREVVDRLAAVPAPWLLHVRADLAFDEAVDHLATALERERVVRARQAREVCREADAAVAYLSDEAVAELFALPADVVAALRPRGGRWPSGQVEDMLRQRPEWLGDEDAARREIARRDRRRRQRRRRERCDPGSGRS
jgi:hypothetical protein